MIINERHYEKGCDPLLEDVIVLASLLNIHFHFLTKSVELADENGVCLDIVGGNTTRINEHKLLMFYTYGEMDLEDEDILVENLNKMDTLSAGEVSQVINVYSLWRDEVSGLVAKSKEASVY